jgi:hypothetical protein
MIILLDIIKNIIEFEAIMLPLWQVSLTLIEIFLIQEKEEILTEKPCF